MNYVAKEVLELGDASFIKSVTDEFEPVMEDTV
jgi:hypothetical protein